MRLPKAQGRLLIRSSFLRGIGGLLCIGGFGLVVVSIFLGALVLYDAAAKGGIHERASVVLVGCGVALLVGILLVVVGDLLLRRGWRLAEEGAIRFKKGIHIRW
jgi:hypothetical protein